MLLKNAVQKAPPPANYQFQCLLSDVYEKNDSFKKHINTQQQNHTNEA